MTELFSGVSDEAVDLLLRRRSTTAKAMGEPGPAAEQTEQILRAGMRVPDHGKLAPWRFLVFEGKARAEFGAILERVLAQREPDASEVRFEMERNRFLRAPLIIAVISSPKTDRPIPVWEQRLSAGAVCQNMLIAATALGYGAQWITEWYAYDSSVGQALGLTADERVAGFLYMGTGREPLTERPRPEPAAHVKYWRAAEHSRA